MIGNTISHYKIFEKLGEGGMGIVYKAHDTTLDRLVALKFLSTSLTSDPTERERFSHEARAAAALTNQNIAVVYEIGEHQDQVFIAMEYIEGQLLRDLVGAQHAAPLLMSRVLDIAIQICEGLTAAHKKEIVHRDIKSDNIMITKDGQVKIMDFGLAKVKGATKLTKAGSTVGTAAYMSPEQAMGEEVDQRSDIFSFGVVLYELLTGKLPFRGEHNAALLYSIVNEEPQPVARFNEKVTPEMERIVAKALEKDREDRYQRVDELLSDLRRERKKMEYAKTGSLIGAVPVTEAVDVKKRRPWIMAAGIVGLLLIIITGIHFLRPKSAPVSGHSKSIAVLPFKNLSDSKEDEYFSDGITDDIIAQLSKIADLKVISRTATMRYKQSDKGPKEIGKELGIGTVLEGSVRRSGNHVRIVAQLIDANNEGHLWADTYDKEMTEVFAIQSDVAQRIAAALEAKLSPAEKSRIERKQTGNTEAYQLYLKGRFYWNKRRMEDIMTAIECFKQAIEKDPIYALAYAGLASSYVLIPSYGIPAGEWYAEAQNAATRALDIDSTIAEAHTVLGEIAQDHYFDWGSAVKHFQRAIELDPGYATAHQWYSSTLSYLGRFDEALAEAKRALELDPISLIINTNLGDVFYTMRQYDRAIEQYKNTIALDQTFPWAYSSLASVYEVQGRFDEAIAEAERSKTLGGDIPSSLAFLGWIYARAGRRTDALRVLDELLPLAQHGTPISFGIAFLYYELGEKDKAFEWFERAYQDRETWLVTLGTDPLWDDLRADPRCIALLKKMRLEK